jgi:ribosomal protein S19E (S16A)
VRKLKALGLTISHEVGYEISPRGRAFLDREATRR